MHQLHKNITRVLSSKTTAFLKKSFFFSLLSATLLYILVRLFFFEFPFTISEGFELHAKMLLTIWTFLITCKLVFTGIVLVENNIGKMRFETTRYVPVIKKSTIIIVTAALTYAGQTESNVSNKTPDPTNNSNDELTADTDTNFFISLPS